MAASGDRERIDVTFPSGDASCAAWLYLPAPGGKACASRPVVVLGHGLGATRDMALDDVAEAFRAEGYACLVFDYRHFGDSGGRPRQLLDVERELTDWASAIAYARSHPSCDPDRVVLWGSSFGGGHAITVASRLLSSRRCERAKPSTSSMRLSQSSGRLAPDRAASRRASAWLSAQRTKSCS